MNIPSETEQAEKQGNASEQIGDLHGLVNVARRLIGRLDDFSLGQAAAVWGDKTGYSPSLKAQATRLDRDCFTAALEDYMEKYGARWTNSTVDIERFGLEGRKGG